MDGKIAKGDVQKQRFLVGIIAAKYGISKSGKIISKSGNKIVLSGPRENFLEN